MARKKGKKEKDIIDQLLDNIDFRGLGSRTRWSDKTINRKDFTKGS